MTQRWAKTALRIYRAAGVVVYPALGPYFAWRASKGKEERGRRGERFGRASAPRPNGPLVWIHAASVGETLAIAALIDRLRAFGVNLLLTTGTVTSARLVEERFKDKVIHQYVPLDVKKALNRFLDHWKPDLAIMAESEIWPETIAKLRKRNIPQILVNARMSDRSFAAWSKRKNMAEVLFEHFSLVIAQSDEDGRRFSQLGARQVTVSGNLKVDVSVPPVDPALLARISSEIGARPVWAAVSTHEGEELLAAKIHVALKRQMPDLLTIIVPRHPVRAPALGSDLVARGLKIVRRSENAPVRRDTDIYLGDSIGEMGLYLRLTEVAFVGGSIHTTGGHNPLEPAMMGAAVLSGPNIENFRDSYQALIDAGAARLVSTPEELARSVAVLLTDAASRDAMISAGLQTVTQMRGTLDRTMKALDPHIRPLVVQSRLRDLNGG